MTPRPDGASDTARDADADAARLPDAAGSVEPPADTGGGLARLWAGWRHAYVADVDAVAGTTDAGTVFERILASGLGDEATYVLWRGHTVFAILNAYPYATGHLMILPYRPVGDLAGLTEEEAAELWLGVRHAVAALRAAYDPGGTNIGLNLGSAAGAGVPDHLHVHVVPRWAGDTNFMTAVAETRVLPESLDVTWRRLREAWPVPDDPAPAIPSGS